MRLIDADKLKQHFAWWHEGGEEADREAEIFEQIIDTQPTVEELKTGKWILIRPDEDKPGNGLYECSECGKGDIHAPEAEVPFCWHCGARMEVDDARDL